MARHVSFHEVDPSRGDHRLQTLNSRVRARFLTGWTPSPGTSFYIGYNDDMNYDTQHPFTAQITPGLGDNSRTFFVKMSYLFGEASGGIGARDTESGVRGLSGPCLRRQGVNSANRLAQYKQSRARKAVPLDWDVGCRLSDFRFRFQISDVGRRNRAYPVYLTGHQHPKSEIYLIPHILNLTI